MPVSSLNIRLFTKLNMTMGLIEYFNPISCAPGGLRYHEKYRTATQGGSANDRALFAVEYWRTFLCSAKDHRGWLGWLVMATLSFGVQSLDSSLITCSAHLVIKMKA